MVNWIWNKLLTKECVVVLIAAIVILLIIVWAVDDRNQRLQIENQRLVDRQAKIDYLILEGMKSIFDAFLQPVEYVEADIR